MSPILRIVLIFILLSFSVSHTEAQQVNSVISENIREQLVALQELCDEGLVSPEVCKEKQRAILGLLPKGSEPRGTASAAPMSMTTPRRSATEYHHPLGFYIELPSGWQVLDPKTAADDLERIRDRISGEENAGHVLRLLEDRIQFGTMGLLQNGEDSINIQKNHVALPANPLVSQKICERLSVRLSGSANSLFSMYDCGLRKLGEFSVFYMDHDARQDGMRSIQYWIEKTAGETLVFMLNCKNENLKTRRREFETMVTSIRWD